MKKNRTRAAKTASAPKAKEVTIAVTSQQSALLESAVRRVNDAQSHLGIILAGALAAAGYNGGRFVSITTKPDGSGELVAVVAEGG